jgi:hypothetical protein
VRRSDVAQTFADLIGFARGVAVRLGPSKSTEVQLEASADDGARRWSELWGHAPLLYKPASGAEHLYVELGDERVVFATKDRRWQIETGDGEVVLRAMGASAAYVRLTPDGTCTIEAKAMNLGGESGQLVALSPLVETAISTAIAGHTHSIPGGASGNGILAGSVSSTAAQKTKAE